MKTSFQLLLRGVSLLGLSLLAISLPAQTEKIPHSERSFFEKAAQGGAKEVEISQAVISRLTNPQVRDFAQTMINDHTAVNAELTTLAVSKGITLPVESLKVADKWAVKGGDLDEDYVEQMKDDHQEAVKLFEKASKSKDPEVAAFAQKTLPSLLHHLEMAKGLKKTVK